MPACAQVAVTDSMKVVYPENAGVTMPSARKMRHTAGTDTTSQAVGKKHLRVSGEAEDSLDTYAAIYQKKNRKVETKITPKPKRNWETWRPDPKRALWMALVIPGGGQIYNRKYWKLPIFYGGFVGCIYALTWNNQMYHDYAQAYMDIMDNNPETHSYDQFLHLGTQITDANRSRYQEIFRKRKNRYRRWRDLASFVTIGVYALSVIDAYVDASLSDFDISEDLSIHVAPRVMNNGTSTNPVNSTAVGVGASLTF